MRANQSRFVYSALHAASHAAMYFVIASRMPPLGTNSPAPPVSYGSVSSPSTRVVTPYVGVGASQRIISARRTDSRRRPFRGRGRGQAEVSKFTGICRGC